VASGRDDQQVLKVAAKMLKKTEKTADNGLSSILGFGRADYNCSLKSVLLQNVGQIVGMSAIEHSDYFSVCRIGGEFFLPSDRLVACLERCLEH
jgi:hypothetical protein